MEEGCVCTCTRNLTYFDNKGRLKVLDAGRIMTFKMMLSGQCVLVWCNKIFLVNPSEVKIIK